MKKIVILFLVLIILISGCDNKCGDSICQAFEERKGNCIEDCKVEEMKKSPTVNQQNEVTEEMDLNEIESDMEQTEPVIPHEEEYENESYEVEETKETCSEDCEQQIIDEFDLSSGDYDFSLEYDGLTRTYKVHVPLSYDQDTSTPLVIYIHGGGGNADSAYFDEMDKTADKFGFILVAPEGTGEVKLGKLRASWNGGKWETGECCGDADDVGFISEMVDELRNKFNIDEKRVYATGISNGGLMTNRLACELSDKITAIATIAPAAIPSNCNPSKEIPIMNIHGTGDRCNPFYGGEPSFSFCANVDYTRMMPKQVVDSWIQINGCLDKNVIVYENGDANCISYNECDNGVEVRFCKVEGMGHTWPDGSQYLSSSLIGPVSYDISSDQIWEFFEKYKIK